MPTRSTTRVLLRSWSALDRLVPGYLGSVVRTLWQCCGQPVTRGLAGRRRTFARIAKRAGLDVSFPYILRHTAVSLFVDAGNSTDTVADMLGDDPLTLYRHY